MSEEIDARFLRSMLYEPLPGSAAIILAQLGIIEPGQVSALGARTYDAESARLSLALDDGRTVELERAMHLHTENGYAVRIRSRAGQTISRSFIHIDRNLGVRNLYNDRMVYIDEADLSPASENADPSEAQIEVDADHAHESQTYDFLSEPELHNAHLDPVLTSPVLTSPLTLTETSTPASLEEQGGFALQRSESSPDVAPQQSAVAESNLVEEDALDVPMEMLEILPGADISTIIYFHETLSPEPEQATSEPAVAAETATPEALAAPGDSSPEPTTQAELSVTTYASEAAAVLEVLATPEPASQEPRLADSIESSAPESPSATELPALVENSAIPAPTTSQAPEPQAPEPQASEPQASEPQASEPLAAAEPEPSAPKAAESQITEPETDPEYAPLYTVLTPSEAAAFTFIAQTGTIHTYEHRDTLRYIHIDAPSGLFYDQTRTPISRAAALKRALTPQPTPSPVAAAEEEESHSSPELQAAPPDELQLESAAVMPVPDHHLEPELRTRRIPAARAAVKPEPAPEAAAQEVHHGLSLDAFTRKHGSPLERQSLRNRIGDLGRVFRLGRNQNGSEGNQDS